MYLSRFSHQSCGLRSAHTQGPALGLHTCLPPPPVLLPLNRVLSPCPQAYPSPRIHPPSKPLKPSTYPPAEPSCHPTWILAAIRPRPDVPPSSSSVLGAAGSLSSATPATTKRRTRLQGAQPHASAPSPPNRQPSQSALPPIPLAWSSFPPPAPQRTPYKQPLTSSPLPVRVLVIRLLLGRGRIQRGLAAAPHGPAHAQRAAQLQTHHTRRRRSRRSPPSVSRLGTMTT